MAMVKKALLMPPRFGSPKLTFEAPQVVFTRSSLRRRLTMCITWRAALLMAPMGITSGSTTTSLDGMPWSAARSTIFLATLVAYVRVFRDTGLVVGNGDDGGAVLRDQGEHRFEPVFLAGHGVDQRLALVGGQARLQRRHDGGIDGQRHVGDLLNQPDRLGQDRRFVGERYAGVDIEHVRSRLHLGDGVRGHTAVIAGLHLGGEHLAAGGIDALADDHERPVEADDDFPGGGTDDGVGHRAAPDAARAVAGRQGVRPSRMPEPATISGTRCSWR